MQIPESRSQVSHGSSACPVCKKQWQVWGEKHLSLLILIGGHENLEFCFFLAVASVCFGMALSYVLIPVFFELVLTSHFSLLLLYCLVWACLCFVVVFFLLLANVSCLLFHLKNTFQFTSLRAFMQLFVSI